MTSSITDTYGIDLSSLSDLGACPLSPFLVRLDPLVLFLPEFVKRATDAEMPMPTYRKKSSAELTSHFRLGHTHYAWKQCP